MIIWMIGMEDLCNFHVGNVGFKVRREVRGIVGCWKWRRLLDFDAVLTAGCVCCKCLFVRT